MSVNEEEFKKTEAYKKIEENAKTISNLMRENEELLKENGFDPPADNIRLTDNARIKFPPYYVRQADFFRTQYRLNDIYLKNDADVEGKNISDNCAYALIESDIYNYRINRFGYFGVVESLIYKNGIINFVSIIESMIMEGVKKYAGRCDRCSKKESCGSRICTADLKKRDKKNNSRKDKNFGEYIDLLEQKNFFGETNIGEESIYQKLRSKKDIRNYVHITKADVNSLRNKEFTVENYNECVRLFQIISSVVYERIKQQEDCLEQDE